MFTGTSTVRQFLLHALATGPWVDYCRERGIPCAPPPGTDVRSADEQRWADALVQLPEDERLRVERDLAKVSELSGPDAQAHLLAALDEKEIPPVTIAGGAALALWCLLHHPDVFHEVFLHHQIQEVESWRVARTQAGLNLEQLRGNLTALATSLQTFFDRHENTGRFCTIDAQPLPDACCFIASVADRLHFLNGFTDTGEPTTQRLWPAFPVLFVYYPQDGTLLLKSRQRSEERILDLFQRFGKTVLGIELTKNDLGQRFALDRLKTEHQLLPDADDMTQVRVKALHLRYPPQHGRRQLKLETLAGDEPSAIFELLRTHAGEQRTLDQLHVSYAELQLHLRVDGRSRSHIIRLWRNRCNLPQTALGDRLRRCLIRWHLLHEHKP